MPDPAPPTTPIEPPPALVKATETKDPVKREKAIKRLRNWIGKEYDTTPSVAGRAANKIANKAASGGVAAGEKVASSIFHHFIEDFKDVSRDRNLRRE